MTLVIAGKRDTRTFMRQAARAKTDRLRRHYAALARASKELSQVAREMLTRWGNETVEQRDARLASYIDASLEASRESLYSLQLEAGTEDVLGFWDAAWKAYVEYHSCLVTNQQAPGTFGADEMRKARKAIGDGAEKLAVAAKAHLAALEPKE